eukprot:GILI01016271.1.p1 GENE.GILI01016271.1~~GILI01016271.1.p1  ORF type:complete len:217 (-),score=9.43 GILI01016271.1:37-687(-)
MTEIECINRKLVHSGAEEEEGAPLISTKRPRNVSPQEHTIPISETFTYFASRIYFSTFYSRFYIVLILANIFCIFWTVRHMQYPDSAWFMCLEVFISFVILFDVLLRMASLRAKFFNNQANIFDLIVTSLGFASLFLFLRSFNSSQEEVLETVEEAEDVFGDIMFVLRNIIQYLRLVLFVKSHHQMKQYSVPEDITIPESQDVICVLHDKNVKPSP